MKYDCGETWAEHLRRLSDWHPFFCLFPRQVADHDCRWLEWIERKGTYIHSYAGDGWSWEYQAKPVA